MSHVASKPHFGVSNKLRLLELDPLRKRFFGKLKKKTVVKAVLGIYIYHFLLTLNRGQTQIFTASQELGSRDDDEASVHDWARAAFAMVMSNHYDVEGSLVRNSPLMFTDVFKMCVHPRK